jgi:patatin-like phospholipase/acyl hydrolase
MSDGGGISIITALATLKALMKEVGFNAKPCDYFDMIAGSETGG